MVKDKHKKRSFTLTGANVEILASGTGGDTVSSRVKPHFRMMPLYSGGPIHMPGPEHKIPYFLDIEGGDITPPVEAWVEHEGALLAGDINHTWKGVNADGTPNICASGPFQKTAAAHEVITAKKALGKKWRCSIHTWPDDGSDREVIAPGERFTVNGREFIGPAIILRRWKLREGSFVHRGADAANACEIIASGSEGLGARDLGLEEESTPVPSPQSPDPKAQPKESQSPISQNERKYPMTPEARELLISLNYNPDECPQEVIALAEEMVAGYNLQPKGEPDVQPDVSGDGNPPEKEPVTAEGEKPAGGEPAPDEPAPDEPADGKTPPKKEGVSASGNWSSAPGGKRPNPKRMKPAGRPYTSGGGPLQSDCLEIALMRHLGIPEAGIKATGEYSDQAMDATTDRRFRNFSIQDFATVVNKSLGYGDASMKNDPEFTANFFDALTVSRRTPTTAVLASGGGFSTIPAMRILSNLTNHAMRYYYDKFTSVAERLSEIVNTNDLKPFYTYDYAITDGLLEVGKDAEIPATTLTEEPYENQVKTYGRLLMITEEDIINDNLHAFNKLLQKFARKAHVEIERRWFQTLLDNISVFNETLGTRLRGDLPLSYNNIGLAMSQFGEIEALGSTDAAPEYIEAELKFLLVPKALEWGAKKLVAGAGIAYGGDEILGDENMLSKALEVVSSPYFGPKLAGGSNTHWAVFPDPSDCPVLQIAYHNGAKAPQCQAFPSQPNYLAQIFRVVHRWGIGTANPRCGVYSAGTGT